MTREPNEKRDLQRRVDRARSVCKMAFAAEMAARARRQSAEDDLRAAETAQWQARTDPA